MSVLSTIILTIGTAWWWRWSFKKTFKAHKPSKIKFRFRLRTVFLTIHWFCLFAEVSFLAFSLNNNFQLKCECKRGQILRDLMNRYCGRGFPRLQNEIWGWCKLLARFETRSSAERPTLHKMALFGEMRLLGCMRKFRKHYVNMELEEEHLFLSSEY